jgi:hypothetical protein
LLLPKRLLGVLERLGTRLAPVGLDGHARGPGVSSDFDGGRLALRGSRGAVRLCFASIDLRGLGCGFTLGGDEAASSSFSSRCRSAASVASCSMRSASMSAAAARRSTSAAVRSCSARSAALAASTSASALACRRRPSRSSSSLSLTRPASSFALPAI